MYKTIIGKYSVIDCWKFLNVYIINYDLDIKLSEVKNWQNTNFEFFVSNQVFYQFSQTELENLLIEIKKINPQTLLIIGISRRSLLNKIGKCLLLKFKAHENTKLTQNMELSILRKYLDLVKHKSVFFLSDIYLNPFFLN